MDSATAKIGSSFLCITRDISINEVARDAVPTFSVVCITMTVRKIAFALAVTNTVATRKRGADNKIALTVDHEFTIRYLQIGLYLRWSSQLPRIACATRIVKSCISNERE